MSGLDFSALTDDQLLTLIKAALAEAVSRHPAVGEAARAAMLDEHERLRILRGAGERETAALRAKERERLAREAAEQVRRQNEAEQAEIRRRRAAAVSEEARAKTEQQILVLRGWLERAAALLDVPARELSIVHAKTRYGERVLVNRGGRFEREHLVDWRVGTGAIKTPRSLIGKKPDLAALAAEYATKNPNRAIVGAEIFP